MEAQVQTGQTGAQTLGSFDPEIGLDREWIGDLDGMIERGFIRALVVYSKTFYFHDGATQRGSSYESLKAFEKFLNHRLRRKTLKVSVVIIPVRRDEIFPALVRGLGDIAAANLTITPEREALVNFSAPLMSDVRELVVTGPAGPELHSLEDLGGQEVHVRRSSSYWESLEALNRNFRFRELKPVRMVAAEEFLEDEDLLEMVNAGLLPAVVVDSHKAMFWKEIFDKILVHNEIAVRRGGQIAWAFRYESPKLKEVVDAFVGRHKKGTLFGNVILKRYLKDNKWVRNNLAGEHRKRFERTVPLFQKYGDMYNFDHLLLTALAYQESHLDQRKRSSVGAIGVMQLLPSTAADPNVGIPDIEQLENNIHAGTKYLRFLRDRYFSGPEIDQTDQTLFTFAAYNAGPARIRRLRSEAKKMGLDPNKWFENVEKVAARRIGRETVQYVDNIAKYYVAYRLATRQLQQKTKVTAPDS
jgi:membrane-bound lytic murein transglycosylase MltF